MNYLANNCYLRKELIRFLAVGSKTKGMFKLVSDLLKPLFNWKDDSLEAGQS